MTDQPQSEESLARAGLEIQRVIDEGLAKWRAARHLANPYGYVTTEEDFEMRRRMTDWERVKKGLPLAAATQQSGPIGWNVRTYLDAQQSQITEPPWRIKGLVVEAAQRKSPLIRTE